MSEILGRGAEAILEREDWDGLESVVKERIKKKYRIDELDSRLRGERTREEVKLLSEARRTGVPTPQVYESKEETIRMEFLGGKKVKEMVPGLSGEAVKKLAVEIGENISRLHERGIVHGDLTTSNMLREGEELYFIDFGLGYFSESIEDQAMDLYLLLEVLKSTHPEEKDGMWKNIKKSYRENRKKGDKVLERVEEIGKRGRYVSER